MRALALLASVLVLGAAASLAADSRIEHVVVIMFENR
jgi:hypothetical protein